jgi:hypothetical protein
MTHVNSKESLRLSIIRFRRSRIDFGDSEMIELLLSAGARADARTRDGLTALDLARQYHHVHLVGALQGRTTH